MPSRGSTRLGGVQRALDRVEKAASPSAVVVADDAGESDDPILSLLTPLDVKRLGVTAEDAARGLSPLDRYRVLGLPSAAGAAARELFDSGRGQAAFTSWLRPAGEVVSAGAAEPAPRHVRDQRIIELRRDGATLAEIATEVGLTEGAVSRVITRVAIDNGLRCPAGPAPGAPRGDGTSP